MTVNEQNVKAAPVAASNQSLNEAAIKVVAEAEAEVAALRYQFAETLHAICRLVFRGELGVIPPIEALKKIGEEAGSNEYVIFPDGGPDWWLCYSEEELRDVSHEN